ncbi:MAG: sugar phosphate nucleotidyltransferase [Verrucomicrobia bacterium]|jgi:NDP-sugar pyrophosphorylase family protein|nr:sugar phosphate nucleotidyltransferase [Verrucomicrobiota bacterium]
MKAVILAGGLGTRLRPFTEIIPKPLLPIGEKSVVEIQIERLKKHGFDEIILATNYKADYLERFVGTGAQYGVKITVSKEQIPLGTAGPLTLLQAQLTEPFVVMNGDILSLLDFGAFYRFALRNQAWLTLAIRQHITPYAFGDLYFDGDHVTGIEEKPNIVKHILAGIYVMRPEIFTVIPPDTYFGMDMLIKEMLRRNLPVLKYEMQEYWLDIGQITDYEKAQDVYHKHFKEEPK